MKKRIPIASGFVVLLSLGLYYFNKPNPVNNMRREQEQDETLKEGSNIALRNKEPKSYLEERSIPSITDGEIKSFRDSFPDKNDVKAEARQNPHNTPKSLINFAERLGPLAEISLQNSKDAKRMTDVLAECVLDNTVAESSRALCLSIIDRLVENFPKLQKKAAKIRELASSEVITLQKSKKLLIQN